MPFDVEMPDGTVIEDVPDGTTKDVIYQKWKSLNSHTEGKQNFLQKADAALTNILPESVQPVVRKAGQFASGFLEGVPGLAALPFDIARAGGSALGIPDEYLPYGSDKLRRTMRDVGISQPVDKDSTVVRTAGEYVGTMFGSAGALKQPITKYGTGMTALSGAAAGVSRDLFPDSPIAELAASLTPYGIQAGINAGFNVAKAAISPLSKSGQEQIVGKALNRLATNPESITAIPDVTRNVRGSQLTTAQATKDPGLLAVERAVQSTPQGSRLSTRFAQQNAARSKLLESLEKDKTALQVAEAARDEAAIPFLRAAEKEGLSIDPSPVVTKIDEILKSGSGKRDVVKGALTSVRNKLYNESGQLETSLDNIYGVRKHITDLLSGKLTGEASNAKLARRELMEIKDALDGQMPDNFRTYLKTYHDKSGPVNQLNTLQEIGDAVRNPGTTVTGERIVSQAKWYNTVTRNKEELSKVLKPTHIKLLDRIGKDLDTGALSVSGGKAAGSNTFQNLSTANLLGEAIGGKAADNPALQNILRPIKWVYKVPEEKMQELLVDAMLDPKLARALASKATPERLRFVSGALQRAAVISTVGATQGNLNGNEIQQQ
jgi:hypothetical protein